jgi:hypothetical protein
MEIATVADSPFSLYLNMRFGLYQSVPSVGEVYKSALYASEVSYDVETLDDYLKAIDDLFNYAKPLDLTSQYLKASHNFGVDQRYGIVLSNGSHDDLMLFHCFQWGLTFRSSDHEKTTIVPIQALQSDESIELLAKWFGDKISGNWFCLLSDSLSLADLKQYRDKLKSFLPYRETGWCIDLQVCDFNPSIPKVSCGEIKTYLRVRKEQRIVSVDIPQLSFDNVLPNDSVWVAELEPSTWSPIRGGFAPSMFVHLNQLLDGHRLPEHFPAYRSQTRIGRGALSREVHKPTRITELKLPSDYELINAACIDSGVTLQLPKISYYQGVMRLIGNFRQATFLRDESMLRLFRDSDFKNEHAFTFLELSRKLKLGDKEKQGAFSKIVETLTERQILLRGYKLECPFCGLEEWYDLSRVNERMKCIGCASDFMLPLSLDFAFKLNRLFSDRTGTDRKGQGIVTQLLSLLYLSELSDKGFHWQADVILEVDGKKTNIDVIAMCDGALVFAECKDAFLPTNQSHRGRSDRRKRHQQTVKDIIEQLRREIACARTMSAKLFFFCTLEQDIPEEIIEFIKTENEIDEQLAVYLLTSDHLVSKTLVDVPWYFSPPNYNLVEKTSGKSTDDCQDLDRTCLNPTFDL